MGKNRIKKANTNKIISKIVHNAKKETKRQHRKRLKESICNPSVSAAHPNKLKIGSINVDGLDLQTDAALRDLLSARDFDFLAARHCHIVICRRKRLRIVLQHVIL